MSNTALQLIVEEIELAAEANPDEAESIFADAAGRFEEQALSAGSEKIAGEFALLGSELRKKAHLHKRQGRETVDDFTELESEHAQAHHEVGHHGDLEIKARQNAIHEARHSRPRISIAPASLTEKTLIGSQLTCKFAPSQADAIQGIAAAGQVVLWQGQSVESQTFTLDLRVFSVVPQPGLVATTTVVAIIGGAIVVVSTAGFAPSGTIIVVSPAGLLQSVNYTSIDATRFLGLSVIPVANAGALVTQVNAVASARPYAEIQMGTMGFTEPTFRVDVGRGVRLTGEGNYVSVVVGMGAPLAGFPSAIYTLGARMGFFAAPTVTPLMFTSYIDQLAPTATSPKIVVPERANFILPPQMSDVLTGSIQINFLDSTGNTIYSLPVPVGGAVAPIPATGDIVAITVQNTGVLTQNVRIPWQIST